MKPKNNVWFDTEQHLYFADEARTIIIPNVSAIIAEVCGDSFKSVPEEIRMAALKNGTGVHKATESHDKGEDVSSFGLYCASWIRFKKDFGLNDKKFDLIEVPLFSREFWYATTPDRCLFSGGIVIEIKTGRQYKIHRVQTASHAIAIEENYDVKINQRIAVYLTESTYKMDIHDNQKDFYYWKSIVGAFHWKEFE